MTTSTETSVRREITVAVPVERAFTVFTEQFDRIKPREHNMLAAPIVETVLQARIVALCESGWLGDSGDGQATGCTLIVLAETGVDRLRVSGIEASRSASATSRCSTTSEPLPEMSTA